MRVVNVFVIDTHKGPALHPRNSPGNGPALRDPRQAQAGGRGRVGGPRETGPLCKASPQTAPAFTHLPEQLYPPGRLKQLV